jgi:hypothetical protein
LVADNLKKQIGAVKDRSDLSLHEGGKSLIDLALGACVQNKDSSRVTPQNEGLTMLTKTSPTTVSSRVGRKYLTGHEVERLMSAARKRSSACVSPYIISTRLGAGS